MKNSNQKGNSYLSSYELGIDASSEYAQWHRTIKV